ncbi:hypothetical protein QCA50_008568 [Cerrena zonata]|uniref:UvrD-like helicase ATP-binding domain-containing protein n=1 Tax=Cerrena zonata TaxID=2478898 RepID=A0AAW0G4E4_9APHY
MVLANNITFTTSGIDVSLFDPMVLRDQVAFESAICSFEQKLFDPGVDKVKLVDDLMSVRHLFQLVFSAVGEPPAEFIQEFIFQSYPTTAYEFGGSQVQRLLEDLAHFAVAFSLMPSAAELFRSVQFGTQALMIISTVFDNILENDTEQPNSPVSPSSPTRRRRNFSHASQREQRKARIKTSIVIDPKPFNDLSVDVPTSKDEADDLAQKILTNQRHLLEQYFSSLRDPALFNTIQSVYIPVAFPDPEPDSETPAVAGSDSTEDQHTIPPTPSVFPMVQPLRAALHFDSPEGFGEWRVMIPSSAHRDLRDAKRRNPKLFKIIVKKIMELSNGHFSDDNQKKLNNMSVGVPIFEAKMTSDTRLVYQIDCNQDFETGVERQVIQVYGVYTHAQLKRFDWDNLGSKLARRGSTYRERCVFRSEPRQPGKNVIAPGSFPPQAESPTHVLKLSIPARQINDQSEEREKNTMLEKFAMFSKDFLSGIITDDDGAYVFQMSPTEQEIVKHVGSSYVLGRSGTGKTTTMLYKILGIERAWQELLQQDREVEGSSGKPRQMFVTQSKMLAKNVEGYYDKLVASHGMGRRSNQQHHDLLINLDEETEWRKDLPHRFGLLKDEHFPVFLTFDELCKMLENEFDHATKLESSSTTLSGTLQQDSFVSWRRFRSAYWDHFPQNLTKPFEPYLVFGEFMGIIKGSEKTLTSNTGYLDRATYLGLSHRAADMFVSNREELYHLFEAYLRRKKEYRDNDAADRTQKLLRLMTELGIPGQVIDYIYVDETQDNLLIDTLVLRSLCRNSTGLFWAGDTAQTISAGSAFRFKDLKAFLWRVENKLYNSSFKTTKALVHPKEFHLAINYRSHAGIIDCAQTVIHILTKFWPNTIDILKEEKGDNDGGKPIMFTGWTEHSLPFEQHLFGDRHHQIEFGANQCILVRDEKARDQLRERVGAVGMILTIQESKGLEFNDVLLYNFFKDSDVSLSHWRIVLKLFPDNLDSRHAVVCRELKFLYVAITRARNNVWIADVSNKGDPMRDIWFSRAQIEICTPNDPIPQLAVSSAQAEWAEKGHSLFKNGTYRQAVHCFERAGMEHERNVAYAYSLQQEAFLLPEISLTRAETFRKAADLFIQCAMSETVPDETRAYYGQAGRCLTESGDHSRAGDIFLAAEKYTASAQAYRKADMFDTAVHVVHNHEDAVDSGVASSIVAVAKLHYFKAGDVEKVFDLGLFQSPEEARDYAEDFGFDQAEADILEKMGQITSAAALHFREGRYTDALKILLSAPVLREDIQEMCVDYLLKGLWRFLSIGIDFSMNLPVEALSLLNFTSTVMDNCSPNEHDRIQIEMFQGIERQEWSRLFFLGNKLLNDFNMGNIVSQNYGLPRYVFSSRAVSELEIPH